MLNSKNLNEWVENKMADYWELVLPKNNPEYGIDSYVQQILSNFCEYRPTTFDENSWVPVKRIYLSDVLFLMFEIMDNDCLKIRMFIDTESGYHTICSSVPISNLLIPTLDAKEFFIYRIANLICKIAEEYFNRFILGVE